jgi:hypothetical protein
VHALALLLAVAAADETQTPTAPPPAPPTEPQSAPKNAVPPEGQPKDSGPAWTRPGIGFGGVPAIAYNPDAGFEFGLVGNIYDYDGKTAPYKNTLHLLVLFSTKLVQHHALSLDSLQPFDLPVRVNLEVGYFENLGQNYCGIGPGVTCSDLDAKKAAAADGLDVTKQSPELDTFLRHYYAIPYIQPYGQATIRYRLNDPAAFTKVEAQLGWRGDDFIPGTIFDDNHDGKLDLFPYPGSLYAHDFPGGEPGFLSVGTVGIDVDARDNEPSPRHGYYVEATLRGSHPFIGSNPLWTYAGADVKLQGYTRVIPGSDRLVLAMRWILDGMVGNPPIVELGNTGYPGSDLGRGIRGQRYLGNVKIMEQQELRYHFFEFDVGGQEFGFIANAFLDAGYVARDFAHLDDPFVQHTQPILPIGMGGAFLISWNQNFIVRLDVATSSVEGWPVYPYITLGQSF